MSLQDIRWLARRAFDAGIWRPTNAGLIWRHLVYKNRNQHRVFTDRDHLLAAARWLEQAQDVTGDGGVSGRYLLGQGWTASYPETTGYIIPTFIALSTELGSDRFQDRAQQAVDFLLPLQFADGGFPGLEIGESIPQPSMFNTAQILGGLLAWHVFSGDDHVLDAARRAANWLVSIQDPDGAWRNYTYKNTTVTYSAYASAWLAKLGSYTGDSSCLDAAEKHFDWVLGLQDAETGWFDVSGFSSEDHKCRRAVTHTIAYTLCGLLITAEILGRSDGLEAVEIASAAIARRLELSRRLPGMLDHCWRPQKTYACLTGNAQMALVWLRLYSIQGDARFLNAALKALDYVKAAQPMSSVNPGIRGGIPGSYPIWGDYIYMGLPNWAAKFSIDALIAKKKVLSEGSARPHSDWPAPMDLPQSLPDIPEQPSRKAIQVIMYSAPGSRKVQQMVTAWSAWKFKPALVVIERRPELGIIARLIKRVEEDGFGWIMSRLLQGKSQSNDPTLSGGVGDLDLVSFCAEQGIPMLEVGRLDSAESIAAVRLLQPDLAIHAGAGILRAPLPDIPRLGTLNAHMGILPCYRGMNAAEWLFFERGLVGCTVHLIDPGIDTGDILCVRRVSITGVCDIRGLRERVDQAQIGLLGEVVRFILNTGDLPPRRKQTFKEGRQFFRMHPEIVTALEAKLKGTCLPSGISALRHNEPSAPIL